MGKTRKLKAREKLAGRKRGNGREREPVINSEMSMSWNLSQISREIMWRNANPLCERERKQRVGRQHTTFTSCQNAACSNEYFSYG